MMVVIDVVVKVVLKLLVLVELTKMLLVLVLGYLVGHKLMLVAHEVWQERVMVVVV